MAEQLANMNKTNDGMTAIVTGTSSATVNGNVLLDFPHGYSEDNCCITSLMYKTANDIWRYITYTPTIPYPVTAFFAGGQITVTTRDAVGASVPVRIMLQKF